MKGYFESIYQGHKQVDSGKTPAPKNFWPKSYQFYKCNPVQTFSATVLKANTAPKVTIDLFVEPAVDRATLTPLAMPTELLSIEELLFAISVAKPAEIGHCLAPGAKIEDVQRIAAAPRAKKDLKNLYQLLPTLNEALRAPLSLRDTDRPVSFAKEYRRR